MTDPTIALASHCLDVERTLRNIAERLPQRTNSGIEAPFGVYPFRVGPQRSLQLGARHHGARHTHQESENCQGLAAQRHFNAAPGQPPRGGIKFKRAAREHEEKTPKSAAPSPSACISYTILIFVPLPGQCEFQKLAPFTMAGTK